MAHRLEKSDFPAFLREDTTTLSGKQIIKRGEDDQFAQHILAGEIYARIGFAVSLGLGQFHRLAEGYVGR